MARRKITIGDWLRGTGDAFRHGEGMKPIASQKYIYAAHDRRKANEANASFGTGEQDGDGNWTSPVHGTTSDGRPVTISFGKVGRTGQTLVCDGHVDRATFWAHRKTGLGHDHYLVDGTIASKIDNERFK